MKSMNNPWIVEETPEEDVAPVPEVKPEPVWAPQAGVKPGDQCLGFRLFEEKTDRLCVVGAHGGAGTSTVADLIDGVDCKTFWPVTNDLTPHECVVVARTDWAGLHAAKAVARQWASGCVPAVELRGLILVPDRPGRLPRPLVDLAEHVAGGYATVWHMGWLSELRLGGQPTKLPRETARWINTLRKETQ